ncbi:hypothetical protein [Anoxybacteroides tepidamans]|uniref:hypothetical protein n=1 Tax=Anoxybacteroides tepidamans TaxID=265948 RepID=UPI000485FED5|nr:hypothetical protein [Anoxybacillus tepidamans]
MVILASAQMETVYKYYLLLETIKEGFDYIEESFTNYERTQADMVLTDILKAFESINATNAYLSQWLTEEPCIIHGLERFTDVLEEAMALEGQLEDMNAKQRVIQQRLSPAFQEWKRTIQEALQPYVQQ